MLGSGVAAAFEIVNVEVTVAVVVCAPLLEGSAFALSMDTASTVCDIVTMGFMTVVVVTYTITSDVLDDDMSVDTTESSSKEIETSIAPG